MAAHDLIAGFRPGPADAPLIPDGDVISELVEGIHLEHSTYEVINLVDGTPGAQTGDALVGLFALDGVIEIRVTPNEPVRRIVAPDFVLIGPRQSYALDCGAAGGCQLGRVVYRFDMTRAALLLRVLPPVMMIDGLDPEEVEWQLRLAQLIADRNRVPHSAGAAINRRLVEAALIGVIEQYLAREKPSGRISQVSMARIGPSLQAIHRFPERRWTVDALAQLTGMSRTLFATMFSQSVGEAPVRYLTRTRLQHARDLLAQGVLPLAEIAHRCGYGTDVAFARAFRRQYAMSPGQYRQARLGAARTPDQELRSMGSSEIMASPPGNSRVAIVQ